MKKILSIIIILVSLILLAGCANTVPVSNEEYQFSEQIKQSTKGVVALTNGSSSADGLTSGIIFKKESSNLSNKYYVLTSNVILSNNTSISIHLSDEVKYSALNVNINAEDLAVFTFESTIAYDVIEIIKNDSTNLVGKEIFAIGTQVYINYFNMPTEPAIISKIDNDLIIHATNINQGMLGSPLFLKSNGQLVGINVFYSTVINGRPINRINHALNINAVMLILEDLLK